MPRGDGKGPLGQGPLTGRGMGNCTDANATAPGSGLGNRANRFFHRNLANPSTLMNQSGFPQRRQGMIGRLIHNRARSGK